MMDCPSAAQTQPLTGSSKRSKTRTRRPVCVPCQLGVPDRGGHRPTFASQILA